MGNMGRILFIVGIVIAAAMGLGFSQPWLPWVLVVLGAVVGFLNVTGSESRTFLISGIAMTLAATAFRNIPYIGDEMTAIMGAIMTFLSGAIFVVAAITLFQTTKD